MKGIERPQLQSYKKSCLNATNSKYVVLSSQGTRPRWTMSLAIAWALWFKALFGTQWDAMGLHRNKQFCTMTPASNIIQHEAERHNLVQCSKSLKARKPAGLALWNLFLRHIPILPCISYISIFPQVHLLQSQSQSRLCWGYAVAFILCSVEPILALNLHNKQLRMSLQVMQQCSIPHILFQSYYCSYAKRILHASAHNTFKENTSENCSEAAAFTARVSPSLAAAWSFSASSSASNAQAGALISLHRHVSI